MGYYCKAEGWIRKEEIVIFKFSGKSRFLDSILKALSKLEVSGVIRSVGEDFSDVQVAVVKDGTVEVLSAWVTPDLKLRYNISSLDSSELDDELINPDGELVPVEEALEQWRKVLDEQSHIEIGGESNG